MNWEALLSTQKLGNDEKEPEEFSRYPMNEFEKDRWIKATLSGPG